jgi:hypothetical protein
MSYMHPAALEARRKYLTRHDAWRFAPPGTPEAKMPGWLDPSATRVRLKEAQEEEARAAFAAEVKALQAQQDRLCEMLAEVKYQFAWRQMCRKYGYNPAQSRDELGRWADAGGGASTGVSDDGAPRGPILSDASPDPLRPGAQYAEAASKRYSVNLEADEAPRGIGHTLREHVGKSDAELIRKLDEDWQRFRTGRFEITEYLPAQGSFSSRESASDFVNRTLEDNKETVDRVASGRAKEAMVENRFGYVTGKEAFRANGDAEPHIRNTYGVRVVIRHDLRSENGYRVYTAFPVNELVRRR